MSTEPFPAGPDVDSMIQHIRDAWPDAVVATIDSAAFFSLDDAHWPNFATVVWTDEHDMGNPSDLARDGVYRVNIGLGKATYDRLVGAMADPDYAAFDTIIPHPVYAKQRWVSILNPSHETVRTILMPLIGEAHDRLVGLRRRQAAAQAARATGGSRSA